MNYIEMYINIVGVKEQQGHHAGKISLKSTGCQHFVSHNLAEKLFIRCVQNNYSASEQLSCIIWFWSSLLFSLALVRLVLAIIIFVIEKTIN